MHLMFRLKRMFCHWLVNKNQKHVHKKFPVIGGIDIPLNIFPTFFQIGRNSQYISRVVVGIPSMNQPPSSLQPNQPGTNILLNQSLV